MRSVGFLYLLFLSSLSLAASTPSTNWDEFQTYYSNQNYEKAIHHLDSWIKEARAKGIESAEAYYNLSTAHLAQEDLGLAVYYLLQSLRRQDSPLRAWRDIRQTRKLEAETGIRNPISSTFVFRLGFLLSENWIAGLITLAIWMIIFSFYIGWLPIKSMLSYRPVFASMGGACLFLSGVVFADHFLNQNLGVIVAAKENPELFTQENEGEKILELTNGLIVRIGEVKGQRIKVIDPVVGWVNGKYVLPLSDPPLLSSEGSTVAELLLQKQSNSN